MKTRNVLTWLVQILSAAILLSAGVTKFLADPASIALFQSLGMEPVGRFLIATTECAAALLLLTQTYSAIGASLALATMLGATIAHLTKLGLNTFDDGGLRAGLVVLLVAGSAFVLFERRKQIPLIGDTL